MTPTTLEAAGSSSDFETCIKLTGFGKYNYLILIVSLMASLAQQLSISAISYILPSAECELQLSPEDKGTLNATGYIGMILSAYVWGFLSDTVGRRRLLVFGYLFDGVCNLTGSFAQSYWFLFAFKLLNGVIMCGPLSVQRTYEAEFHSVKYRGKQNLLAGIFMSLANIVIPVTLKMW
ncbi:synaptic vesicle glycoprotein 2A-like [Schistocerca nitens]|uniref:synaptic vesicle glycoprotein 2A-like n=1 Tax=Schistocerca nitens TaxID=7011 RepID=UPI002118F721|nr:synaptic vesicle glycoprotein 2A-like [Schistocerca nitens]